MDDKHYGSIVQDALFWKYPGVPLVIYENYKDIIWPDGFPIPSMDEVDKIIEDFKVYLKDTEYKEKRKAEYPQVESQLDMLWMAMDKGILPKDDEFYVKIKAIKDKYPKPTSI